MATHRRRAIATIAATLLMLAGTIVAATPASSTHLSQLVGIRTGQHSNFDRIVLDMSGIKPSKLTHVWGDELRADGSGFVVWLTGEHFVNVSAFPAAAHNDAGKSTYTGSRKFRTRHLKNVMAVAITGDYEGYLSVGFGTRRHTWIKRFTLSSPPRVVIDIGH